MNIKNQAVNQYHTYLESVFNNPSLDRQVRKNAKSKMELIENLVAIYEEKEDLSFEEITWCEIGDSLLPEEQQALKDSLKEQYILN